ncbi:MAG: glutamate racemase [Thermodesulfovibrionaceae bacterium]
MKEKPIGIFDSGVGGLTVVKEITAILPNENILYLGDTARVPYGIRSPETVIKYSLECADFLFKKGIKILVVACNTSSSISLEILKKRFPIPVIGVIIPGIRAALKVTKNKKIGVIGTEATIQSNAYSEVINILDPNIEIISKACPLFVPIVEEGILEGAIADLIIERYLLDLKHSGIDTLILGCTHYPLLKNSIQRFMNGINLVDSATEVAKEVKNILSKENLINTVNTKGDRKFFVTDAPLRFKRIGELFLNTEIKEIFQISLKEAE